MGKVAYEIQVLIDKQKQGKKVKLVGYPAELSPQELIIYQWEKIYTVENALRLPEQHSIEFKKYLKESLCDNCKTGEIVCLRDLEKKVKIEILESIFQ